MKRLLRAGILAILAATVLFPGAIWAHITLRPEERLKPGIYAARIRISVPNERHVATTRITLEVPEDFRRAGGRLNWVEQPVGWEVRIEKEAKPVEIYKRDLEVRAKREERRAGAQAAKTEEERREDEIRNESLKNWITRVTFEGGSIPPDSSKEFVVTFRLPDRVGRYYFPSLQGFADGKETSWSERIEGEAAEHQAPSVVVQPAYDIRLLALLGATLVLVFLLVQPVKRYRQWKKAQATV